MTARRAENIRRLALVVATVAETALKLCTLFIRTTLGLLWSVVWSVPLQELALSLTLSRPMTDWPRPRKHLTGLLSATTRLPCLPPTILTKDVSAADPLSLAGFAIRISLCPPPASLRIVLGILRLLGAGTLSVMTCSIVVQDFSRRKVPIWNCFICALAQVKLILFAVLTAPPRPLPNTDLISLPATVGASSLNLLTLQSALSTSYPGCIFMATRKLDVRRVPVTERSAHTDNLTRPVVPFLSPTQLLLLLHVICRILLMAATLCSVQLTVSTWSAPTLRASVTLLSILVPLLWPTVRCRLVAIGTTLQTLTSLQHLALL